MAWRFKVSKFKNAAPRYPKREETILEVPVERLMQSCGNHVSSSCSYIAFNTDTGGGGNVGILPLQTTGRIGQSLPLLKAHADFVTDMCFSPFDDRLLATCSSDQMVKVWSLPEEERLSESIDSLSHHATLPAQEKRVETVSWSPVASGVLAASVFQSVKIFDVEAGEEKLDISCHGDQVHSMCWHGNSTLIATTCKDKKLRILDPRSSSVAQECEGHQSNRDSRVVWMGDQDNLITAGFNMSRQRELKLWDARNLKSALTTQERDSNTGTLMPLFDEDTNMLFLVGKADTCWTYLEVTTTDPYFTQNAVERSEQIKGATLIPKRAVEVMEGEVDRLMVLIHNSIVPLPYIVPRRQYKDFHDDLFPDTRCGTPALDASQWFQGQNAKVELMSLDPSKRSRSQPKVTTTPKKQTAVEANMPKKVTDQVKTADVDTEEPAKAPFMDITLKPVSKTIEEKTPEPVQNDIPREPSKAAKTFASFHQSKCKYLKGTTEHPNTHIVNIRRLCRTLPGESNLFYANAQRCAIPLEGSGGLIGILELDKPGRLPDTGIPVIQNGSKVNDMVWDPFDNQRILVGCENAKVYIWKIPKDGLTETITEPQSYLMSHTEKMYFVRFHPLARDVVVTSAYDFTLKIWNLQDNTVKIDITCHPDQIFCAEWSPDGRYLATVCKDGKIRIFDPRSSLQPIKEGAGPDGSRGARVVWCLNMKYLVVSGFEKQSIRQLLVYSVDDLASPLHTMNMDHSPAILIPYYDEGTTTVFLTGRGDSSILAFEVSEEFPHLFALATTSPEGLHQGLAMMPKSTCDVRKIEFARMWRLTQTTIEPISFTVPRAKPEYFQDDLFPDTPVEGEPTMTSSEWFGGANTQPKRVSLRPADMKPLSEAPVEAPKPQKYESYNPETYKTDEQKKEELLSAITNKLDIYEEAMPQDLAEGVDSDEWGDD